jgi:predicted DNA-binding protein (MmcQ/YjbR family)
MTRQDNLDLLLVGHPPTIQEIARAARDLVLSVKPEAHQDVETGWGGYLLFKQVAEAGNTVCWVSLHKKHVSLGFSEGAGVSDPAGLLEGSGKHSRQVKLKSVDDLQRPELRELLNLAWQRQPDAQTLTHALASVRRLCLALPGTSEKLSHGHPTFYAGKKSFAVYGIYSPSVAFKAPPGNVVDLADDPRFFPTPYMAQNGWWSLRLDAETNWDEVGSLLQQSYLEVATKTLRRQLQPTPEN